MKIADKKMILRFKKSANYCWKALFTYDSTILSSLDFDDISDFSFSFGMFFTLSLLFRNP